MRKLAVVYLRTAEKDLLEICDYIKKESPAKAQNWLSRVDRALLRLASFPESGAKPKDERLAVLGYRMVVIGDYLAFYVLRSRRVEIRRVLHGKQLYSFLF